MSVHNNYIQMPEDNSHIPPELIKWAIECKTSEQEKIVDFFEKNPKSIYSFPLNMREYTITHGTEIGMKKHFWKAKEKTYHLVHIKDSNGKQWGLGRKVELTKAVKNALIYLYTNAKVNQHLGYNL